jgi:large subunit ribosomal protein L20
MARSKRGKIKLKKRKRLLKLAKGYKWHRSKKKKSAREAILHAGVHSFRGRKEKKRNFRRLWQIHINNFVRNYGLNYSQFIHLLRENNINLNRKVLSELARKYPQTLEKIIEEVKVK